MDGSEEASACAACGCDLDGASRCEVCGTGTQGVALTVLPREAEAPLEAPVVKLVRQLKMPTLDRLELDLDLDSDATDRLPATMRSVEEALDRGDLPSADDGLDEAIGAVIAGPGHERRRRNWGVFTVVLWAWCGVLFLLFLLNWLTSTG